MSSVKKLFLSISSASFFLYIYIKKNACIGKVYMVREKLSGNKKILALKVLFKDQIEVYISLFVLVKRHCVFFKKIHFGI